MSARPILLLSILLTISPLLLAQGGKQELNDQLWEAARKGDEAAVKALLDKGADVNAKFRYGATALSYAADKGHLGVVKILLERGADVNVSDTFYKTTPIMWATFKGHAGIVQALLDKGAEGIDQVLRTATSEGNTEIVRIALAKGGIKAETLTAALASAMSDASKSEIAELLKKAGAVPPPEVDVAILNSYAGKYRNEQGMEFTVTVKDGKLFGGPVGWDPSPLSAMDKTTFRPTNFDGVTLVFNLENAKVASMSLKQGQNTTILKRVEETKQP